MARLIASTKSHQAIISKLADLRHRLAIASAEKALAAQDGDLRENAHYKASCEQVQQLSKQIQAIAAELQLIDPQDLDLDALGRENAQKGMAGLGTVITLKWENEEPETYRITTALEEPGVENGLKYSSPLGEMVCGHKIGDTIRFRGNRIALSQVTAPV